MTHQEGKPQERYDMDWLRVIAVCFLIMIHTAAMFDPYPITAVKGRPSFPLILFSAFLHEWRLAISFYSRRAPGRISPWDSSPGDGLCS